MRRRLERLETFAGASAAETYAELADEERAGGLRDYLTELAIYSGELEEADVPELEETRRHADEALAELEAEWRRLEARQSRGA